MTKHESENTLEDWVNYHTSSCVCSGHFQCADYTLKALEESWRMTLKVERGIYLALKNQHAELQRAHDALKHNLAERP